jgi:hypothetical protein
MRARATLSQCGRFVRRAAVVAMPGVSRIAITHP